jgi:tetratricopeptide (TPR) repeat protein
MQIETVLRSASSLIRRGRFTEALHLLQAVSAAGNNHLYHCLLADALQRTGHNLEAELIAGRGIRSAMSSPDLLAHYHFVLGNVLRDRGDNRKSIDHFLSAEKSVISDIELLCWVQFRLLSSIPGTSGNQASLRVSRLKSTLARCGEARPLATFHLWIAKTETIHGNLNGARRHLRVAESLLKQVDDAWLQALFAITSFGVSYHCGDIAAARKWAHLAVEQSAVSGHHETLLASHANLGHIELSIGNLSEAEHCFQTALDVCEEGFAWLSRNHRQD